jgi:hypothetical protein
MYPGNFTTTSDNDLAFIFIANGGTGGSGIRFLPYGGFDLTSNGQGNYVGAKQLGTAGTYNLMLNGTGSAWQEIHFALKH